jgi:choline dehydrogenase-like flavoprotein
VTENINHNVPNSLFLDGCKSLGIHGDFIKQNTAGQPHDCGYCTFTCPTGTKQSSAITWMKDAAEFGCHFLDGLEVDKVVHNAGIATGVTGKKEGIRVIIKSKKIVLSCGSMSTPNLLLKSNIPNLNRHVGKHLRLHPVTLVFGVFPDKDISPHKGSIMTTYSNVVGDLDSMGYGAKLEIPVSHPGIFASSLYWHSDVSHKNKMMIWRHTASVIVLTRDKDSEGTIWVDKEGKTRFDWKFGEFDSCSMIKGMEAGIKILLAAGAKEVYTTQRDHPESFKRDSNMSAEQVFESEEYKSYISKMKKVGAKQAKLSIFSAHQMGTCRMANDAKNGVVDSHGRMHGLKNVYIADASVFPTSSGVK